MSMKTRRLAPLALAVTAGLTLSGLAGSLPAVAAPAHEQPAGSSPTASARKQEVEYLSRGLVAAQGNEGIFLSWRFLGDEPDGLSWNVYRKDGAAAYAKIATIDPRDVQPESDYPTNPGVVKKNTTPSNYTDPDGTVDSLYEVAPVIDGVEGSRQGLSVPMLSSLNGAAGQEGRGAAEYIQLKPAPEPVPLAHFTYRGQQFGPGSNMNAAQATVPGTDGENWYTVDMDLLREFRTAFDDKAPVTQQQLDGWLERLNQHNTTPNALGKATYAAGHELQHGLEGGKITQALYDELEGEFIKYVKNLDSGESLPYAKTADGSVLTSMSAPYKTADMTVGDFDGDGEYEIAVKWRSTQADPMYSEPIFSGSNTTTAPEYVDVYKLDGSLLFRVDMGYNIRANNDHSTTLFAQDFDGDGKSELMLKTGLGTRIGNWDEAAQKVLYKNDAAHVVGGADGLASTTDQFEKYFAEGDTKSLDTYWALLNSFTISYRTPTAGGGNDGVNDPSKKRWIKTYHVGPMGSAKDEQEFFSAFRFNTDSGQGELLDSAAYPHTYQGSVDGDDWAMNPTTQRGNFSYLAFPGPGAGSGPEDYKSQMMDPREAYWLTKPWKAASWGDAQGNRANRYVGVVASLDGKHQFAVSQRGYYARTTFAAFTIENGKVKLQATFDSADPADHALGGTAADYQNRGNHQTQSADLDGDGRDEIVMKAMVLDLNKAGNKIEPRVINGDIVPTIEGQNGVPPTPGVFTFATDAVRNNPLNHWAALHHGDRSALLPVDKDNTVRMFSGSEENLDDDRSTGVQYGWMPGPEAHDPLKGRHLDADGKVVEDNALIYSEYSGTDDEGSVAGNFSNRWPGAQAGGSSAAKNVHSLVTGEVLASTDTARGIAAGENAIWFGGGLTHMGANNADIHAIDDATFKATPYLNTGMTSTNMKSTPTLKADLLGDWREEVVLAASGNRLGIVTSLAPTEYGIRTLMHDPMYREGVANKNTGYDQVGFASFYLGDEAPLPARRDELQVGTEAPRLTPGATVKKLKGGTNELTVSVVVTDTHGIEKTYRETFTIENNAAGSYDVGPYSVFVDTKGNTQVREVRMN